MSETGHSGNSGNSYERWAKTDKRGAGGKSSNPWGTSIYRVSTSRGSSRAAESKSTGKQFTVGSYVANERPSASRPDIFEVNVMSTADEVAKTIIRKQADYGPNNILRSPFGPLQGLTVRLYDKIARLANLSTKKIEPKNESLRDTFVDIAGYGLIGLMILDETFPKE